MTQIKARPTTYKGIEMRSRLEAGFAQWLDRWDASWTYEPKAFGGKRGQYLPDFLISGIQASDGRLTHAYVEVKPPPFWESENTEERLSMFKRMSAVFESEPDAVVLIASPSERTEGYIRWNVLVPDNQAFIDGCCVYDVTIGMDFSNGFRLVLCEPIPVEYGPWFGEWWKV